MNFDKTIVEYVWIDGDMNMRSKTRVLDPYTSLPLWNYDGSSTKQTTTGSSEITLKPHTIFNCPFRKEHHKLVMCSTYLQDGTCAKNNNRHMANDIFNKKLEEVPWYGLEQEFFFINPKSGIPLGFNYLKKTEPQGKYYCGVGHGKAIGREILEDFLKKALYAGITISGINGEVAPGQWEFQVGPTVGINTGDHLWMARYILERTAEIHGVGVSFHPKPVKGNWNGSGCHVNFSTLNMRKENGLSVIMQAIDKLKNKHSEHMDIYGIDNDQRLTGLHETSRMDKFSFGEGNREASIRIPTETVKNKKGYFEDRRPASNIDPYLVTAKIFETVCL